MTAQLWPAVAGLPQAARPLVMAVVNVTPDSFSDGGRWLDPQAAVQHGLSLVAEGADLVDVGGESTRPGAQRTPSHEERRRVLPVIEGLVAAGVIVSVDTMRAEVAAAAVDAGASLINDVSGGLADPDMLSTAAATGAAYVATHWRGHAVDMQGRAHYGDVCQEVVAELGRRVDHILAAGIAKDRLILDPGVGYAKTAEQNWAVLAGIDAVVGLGFPVLVGVSRKGFLGSLLGNAEEPRPALQRDDASTAITALLTARGVWAFRTHTARQHRDAVAAALCASPPAVAPAAGQGGRGWAIETS